MSNRVRPSLGARHAVHGSPPSYAARQRRHEGDVARGSATLVVRRSAKPAAIPPTPPAHEFSGVCEAGLLGFGPRRHHPANEQAQEQDDLEGQEPLGWPLVRLTLHPAWRTTSTNSTKLAAVNLFSLIGTSGPETASSPPLTPRRARATLQARQDVLRQLRTHRGPRSQDASARSGDACRDT